MHVYCIFFLILIVELTFILVWIVEHIVSRADTEDLMLFYNLPAFAKNDTNAFLSGVSRSNGMSKKVCTFKWSPKAYQGIVFLLLG